MTRLWQYNDIIQPQTSCTFNFNLSKELLTVIDMNSWGGPHSQCVKPTASQTSPESSCCLPRNTHYFWSTSPRGPAPAFPTQRQCQLQHYGKADICYPSSLRHQVTSYHPFMVPLNSFCHPSALQ